MERYRAAGAGTDRKAALAITARVIGPPVLVDVLAVALGFGVLTSSHVPANARLGILSVVCVATALVLTFLVLPALLPAPGTVRIPRTGPSEPEGSPETGPGSRY